MREAFVDEARAMARMRHPNVVTVHAFGEHEGRPLAPQRLVARAIDRAHPTGAQHVEHRVLLVDPSTDADVRVFALHEGPTEVARGGIGAPLALRCEVTKKHAASMTRPPKAARRRLCAPRLDRSAGFAPRHFGHPQDVGARLRNLDRGPGPIDGDDSRADVARSVLAALTRLGA